MYGLLVMLLWVNIANIIYKFRVEFYIWLIGASLQKLIFIFKIYKIKPLGL